MRTDVTQLLVSWSNGNREALDRLAPLLYSELRRLAERRLRAEHVGHTINATALVHEAYLRLVDVNQINWQSRAHFMAMAATVMRRILIDHARSRKAEKRGAGVSRITFQEELMPPDESLYPEALEALATALSKLETVHDRSARAIEMRYFGGLSLEETATVLEVSLATVKRDIRFGQAWLTRELSAERERS